MLSAQPPACSSQGEGATRDLRSRHPSGRPLWGGGAPTRQLGADGIPRPGLQMGERGPQMWPRSVLVHGLHSEAPTAPRTAQMGGGETLTNPGNSAGPSAAPGTDNTSARRDHSHSSVDERKGPVPPPPTPILPKDQRCPASSSSLWLSPSHLGQSPAHRSRGPCVLSAHGKTWDMQPGRLGSSPVLCPFLVTLSSE